MAQWTAQKLRNRALEVLGVLAAGENPTSSDAQIVDEIVEAAKSTLALEYQIHLPFEISAIPEAFQVPLRDFVAARIAPAFELANNPGLEDAAVRSMRRINMGRDTLISPTIEYF